LTYYFSLAIRYNPTPKAGELKTYVQTAKAQDERHNQRSNPGYVITSGGRYDQQKPTTSRTLDEYSASARETPQVPAFSLFDRDEGLRDTPDTSEHTDALSSRRDATNSNIRSGSSESRGSERRTVYRSREGVGGNDTVTQYVSRPSRAPQQNSTSSYTGRASEIGQAGTRRGTGSLLSTLALGFTQIPVGDYLACEKFMVANPSIFNEDPQTLVQEAIRLAKEGKSVSARGCVQQTLLLRKCSKMANKDFQRFFKQMKANDRETLQAFLRDFDTTIKAVMASAPVAGATMAPSDQSMKPIHEHKPLLVDKRDQRRPTLESKHSRNSAPRHNSIDEELSAPLVKLAMDERHGQESNNGTNPVVMGPPPPRNPDSIERRLTVSSDESANDNLSIVPDIRGSKDLDDLHEKLDPKYKKRPNAKKFFAEGRVFALLWHQTASESKNRLDLSDAQYSDVGKFGERVFSHIQRMAVVREKHGYCICVPINTYSGQGVLKRGFTKADCLAHSIIYSSNTRPFCKPQESGLMNKKSIAVNMASPEQKLDEMSRIHFGKVHTIEWNVKVMNVGKVSQACHPTFMGYYKLENP
jgi:hypothetical protein